MDLLDESKPYAYYRASWDMDDRNISGRSKLEICETYGGTTILTLEIGTVGSPQDHGRYSNDGTDRVLKHSRSIVTSTVLRAFRIHWK